MLVDLKKDQARFGPPFARGRNPLDRARPSPGTGPATAWRLETLAFLGLIHDCGWTGDGRFTVRHETQDRRGGSVRAAIPTKLAVNVLLAAQVTALAEFERAFKRLGEPARRIVENALETPVCSPAMRFAANSIAQGAYRPALFPMGPMAQDLSYVQQALGGEESAPFLNVMAAIFATVERRGVGQDQMTAIAMLDDWSWPG
ncbi:hypothetical protein [Inquilinus sp. OTU3971]|uniref:hypothetical protein n=1 Tax=Inquilinus sp. OTU3971 TaxID=3043855 RepID=UPI00313D2772